MSSCYTDDAKEQEAEQRERYEAVTVGCGEVGGGGGFNPFLPHPIFQGTVIQNNVFLKCFRNYFHLRFCKLVNNTNVRIPSHLFQYNNSVLYILYSTVDPECLSIIVDPNLLKNKS